MVSFHIILYHLKPGWPHLGIDESPILRQKILNLLPDLNPFLHINCHTAFIQKSVNFLFLPTRAFALTQTSRIISPDALFQVQKGTGRVPLFPISCTVAPCRVPDCWEPFDVKEESLEHFDTITPCDEMGVYDHSETSPPPIRSFELLSPVFEERHGILKSTAHPRGRKHEKKKIIEMVVIR